MAVQTNILQGTSLTWQASGGTYALTCTSLASAAGRQGGACDLAQGASPAYFASVWGYAFRTKFATSPSAQQPIRILLGFSADDTNFPGELGTGDAAYTLANGLYQLTELRALSSIADTNYQQVNGIFVAQARYVVPVIWNAAGTALDSTAGDHTLTMWPLTPDTY